ncbi:type VII secretion-associated serine protease mycosin [Gordonia aichiensis]|uniref:type VII secretion-associated serine protease mycosin n=1 Tax=Gordonia aichiensis TaxID=36820 RepID=UPI0032659474
MIRRLLATAAAAAVAVVGSGGPAAALPPVSALPLGPDAPTEQRTHCASAVSADLADPPPGHRLLDIAAAHRFSRGAGVAVAVIDTGVAPHPRLPRLIPGGDYVGTGDGLTDCDAHGTLVAGLIAGQAAPTDGFVGVAPEATIIAIRQSSGAYQATGRGADGPVVGAGYGPPATLARAVVRAVDLGARVIIVSEVACAAPGDRAGDELLGAALARARERDVVVVAAAGNLTRATACREQNPAGAASAAHAWAQLRTSVSPARFAPLVLVVGAVSAVDGSPAEFSLNGPWVGVAAPGTDVVSVMPGPTGPRLVAGLQTGDGPAPLAGTSYAAPYVAGLAALVRARYPEMSAGEVIDRIVRTAHGGGHDLTVGAGVVDPVAALTDELPEPTAAAPRAFQAPGPREMPTTGSGAMLIGAGSAGCALLGAWLLRRRR